MAVDPHSYARPNEAVITHLHWQAEVDFDNRVINGVSNYNIRLGKGAKEIILDIKGLVIDSVLVDGLEAAFSVGDEDGHMGAPLVVSVNGTSQAITIFYRTSEKAAALQWLNPVQTADKKHPFLFTQSQAILARTWMPIQDSPGIRFTYQAEVKVPTGLMAVMSASNPQDKTTDGKYSFHMDQPIPAYLMALAVGDLKYHALGAKTGVYAEPSVIDDAAHEFAELEEMLATAEKLYGAYRWERYDLIVLPPSFPFGGMENPRLTFVTPTILAGDRSLTSLVAHELAHSWSGNLVTNATWDDFWLNEGFTVYFERRIMEEMYGQSYAEMLSALGYQDLKQTVADLKGEGKSEDTRLKLQLEGRDPDDGVTDIAYEKGYSFLKVLEHAIGREGFDQFLIGYFDENAFKSMTTEAFVAYLQINLINKYGLSAEQLRLEEWIYGEGIPENAIEPVSTRFQAVDWALEKWNLGTPPEKLSTHNWSSHEWLHFIRGLPELMEQENMAQLDAVFDFTKTGNSEMLVAWLQHAIRNNYQPSFVRLENFLIHTGRRKFLVPLYSELMKTEKGREMAAGIYRKARENYHTVAINTLDGIVLKKE